MRAALTIACCALVAMTWSCSSGAGETLGTIDAQTAELPPPRTSEAPLLAQACCMTTGCVETDYASCGQQGGLVLEASSCMAVHCAATLARTPGTTGEPREEEEEEEGEQGDDLSICCVASEMACFETDPGYCMGELGGMAYEGQSCAESCPELGDESDAEQACCFEGTDCEDLSPTLCRLDKGRTVSGESCESGNPCSM